MVCTKVLYILLYIHSSDLFRSSYDASRPLHVTWLLLERICRMRNTCENTHIPNIDTNRCRNTVLRVLYPWAMSHVIIIVISNTLLYSDGCVHVSFSLSSHLPVSCHVWHSTRSIEILARSKILFPIYFTIIVNASCTSHACCTLPYI